MYFGTDGGVIQERAWLIWFVWLCVGFAVRQASRFDGLLFDPFPLLRNGLARSKADAGRGEVLQVLVIAPMVVMLDEGVDLPPGVAGQARFVRDCRTVAARSLQRLVQSVGHVIRLHRLQSFHAMM